MNDAAEIHEYEVKIAQGHHAQYRPLHTALSLVQDAVCHPFARCDKALYYQKWYQRVSIATVVAGAATILLAILEFIIPHHDVFLTYLEAFAGGVTLVLIALGQIGEFKEKWLAAR